MYTISTWRIQIISHCILHLRIHRELERNRLTQRGTIMKYTSGPDYIEKARREEKNNHSTYVQGRWLTRDPRLYKIGGNGVTRSHSNYIKIGTYNTFFIFRYGNRGGRRMLYYLQKCTTPMASIHDTLIENLWFKLMNSIHSEMYVTKFYQILRHVR